MTDRKPNLLLVMTDQQRADAMGCSGGWVSTPNLDRIAREGIRYDRCVTTSPVCVPARLSLATGLYCHNTGIWDNCDHTMAENTRTWMQSIRTAGYRTSLFGKTHWHPHRGDLRDRTYLLQAYGLDDFVEVTGPRASAWCRSHMTDAWEAADKWRPYQEDYAERFSNRPHVVRPSPLGVDLYYDVYVAEQAGRYLQSYDRAEPWFCWVSFPGPHEPWDTPEPYAALYSPADMPPPAPAPRSEENRPQGRLDHMLAHPRVQLGEDEPARLRADYAANITLIDEQIGRLLDIVEARGELDNTVILFTSDHGEMNGDAGLIYKSNFLNGAVRIPLLIRTPQTAASAHAGGVCASPVEWIDIGPTLVELAGGTVDYQQFGRSLAPTLSDPAFRHRADALSELSGEVMLINDRWKVVLNENGQAYLLFDLQDDPGETRNLAGRTDMGAVEAQLRLCILERLVQSQVRNELKAL